LSISPQDDRIITLDVDDEVLREKEGSTKKKMLLSRPNET